MAGNIGMETVQGLARDAQWREVAGMFDKVTRAKLRDPAYFALHTQAAAALREVGAFAWYDSNFLRRFEAAKLFLAAVRPDAVAAFIEGFAPLHPAADFTPQLLNDLFDQPTRARILDISRSVEPGDGGMEEAERRNFGRHVVWDQPYFLQLQRELLGKVSDLAGRELVPGYNFLSLYGAEGKCDPHMDEPYSMYTLDYCIEQSGEWPIYFSRLVDWPKRETVEDWDKERLKAEADLNFAPEVLQPNQAVLFCGSSQWHYRDTISPGGFCSLLFFHYFPEGCEGLVSPDRWAEHFGIAELAPLCDLFTQAGADGFAP
jgi:hypothetical protein